MAEDHTVVVETPDRSGGGSGWIIALVLIVALVIGIVFFTQMSGSETAKDNAITNAANNVGSAAKDVGNAAQDAANNAGTNSGK
jgi:flagellar basal body-associated protein FliL